MRKKREYIAGLENFYVTGDFIEPHAMPHNTIIPLTGSRDFVGGSGVPCYI
jgi:hypothetical protein